MKKILKHALLTIIILISVAVLYTVGFRAVFTVLNGRSLDQNRQIDFSGAGGGLTWINNSNDKTLFFIPSTEEPAVNKLYGDWLKDLHTGQNVNIVVPPLKGDFLSPSMAGSIYDGDGRTGDALFLFSLYRSLLGDDHEIVVLSTGDGSLQALELARSALHIDKFILLSPVHSDVSMRGGFLRKLADLPVVPCLLPWIPSSYGKLRVGPYDILNDDMNKSFSDLYGRYRPSFINTLHESRIRKSAVESIDALGEVKPNRFFIIYGDDDLTYSLEGFERMGDALSAGGSEVSVMRIAGSGRMLLFDNGRERILDLVSILLQ